MARVTYGPLVTKIKGSIGGLTFQETKAGSIVRLKPSMTGSSTVKQSAVHSNLTFLLSEWWCLSIAQKAQWASYAVIYKKYNKWGEEKTLSGWNWYYSINYAMLQLGLSSFSTPPSHTVPDPVPYSYPDVQPSLIRFIFNPTAVLADHSILIFTTPAIQSSSLSWRRYLRLTSTLVTGPFSTFDITSAWESAHSVSYPPSPVPYSFSIGFLIQTVNKLSGISSVGNLKLGSTTNNICGIGCMAIGSTFIIR